MTNLTLSIDAMGGDHGPRVTIEGVALALKCRDPKDRFKCILHGDQTLIGPELQKYDFLQGLCEIRHTDQCISMEDKPAQAIRKRGTSLMNAIQSVKSGEARAIVSSGNTGALMALSKMILKMQTDDLERPAIACSWPHPNGFSTVLDVGANVTSDARQLVEFALMGVAFQRAVHGNTKPKIGLLNVGSEDAKGHEEVREAHRLLREGALGLDYHGFVEGTDLCTGLVDVIVTDGFTGNIALKTAEGTVRFIKTLLKSAFKSSLLASIGAFLAAPALKKMSKSIDPGAANGGPLLGLNGIVIKSHGGAEGWAFSNAIDVAISLAQSQYEHDISQGLAAFSAQQNQIKAQTESDLTVTDINTKKVI